ncbi:MAG: hypothetical protein M3Z64_08895 [Verrucomicrobiota bacterium]|nr:hypothetical protein [Verrucomicrobiota bacterium]
MVGAVVVAAAVALWLLKISPSRESDSSGSPRPDALHAPAKSIAVLPFENLSANQETVFFADGVQDEILSNLAKVADLKVINRTSVIQYKTVRARNLRQIAQQLGVAHVMEGSVWAQTYDRDLADVFAIQSEISKTIADQLQARLSPQERPALERPATADAIPERLYVEAFQQVERASNPDAKAALLEATTLLDEAIARDPHFIRAYGLLFTAQVDLYWQGFDHTPARLELARTTIRESRTSRA